MLQLAHGVGHEFGGKSLQQTVLLARIDANGLRLRAHQIAQHPLHQVEVFVQQGGCRLARGRLLDAQPGLAQVGGVFNQLFVAGIFGVGAQNETPGSRAIGRGGQPHQPLAQRFALGRRYFLGHANVGVLRQKHQQAPGNADLRRQACAFGANRVFEHLHHQRLAFKDLALNGQHRVGREHTGVAVAVARLNWWRCRLSHGPAGRTLARCGVFGRYVGHQIGHMQEGGAVQTNVNKSGLHARQHAGNFAQVDVADQATLQRALQVDFLHRPLFHHRHAGFLWRPIDQDVLAHVNGLSQLVFLERRGVRSGASPQRPAPARFRVQAGP